MSQKQEDFRAIINIVIANLRNLLVCRQNIKVKEGIERELNAMAAVLGAKRGGIYLVDEGSPDHMRCVVHVGRKSLSECFPLKCPLEDLAWILERLEENSICCIDQENAPASDDIPVDMRLFRPDENQYLFIKAQSAGQLFSLLVFELPLGIESRAIVDKDLLLLVAQVFTNTQIHLMILTEKENQIHFEQLLSDISRRFINLKANRIDAEIEQSLKRITQFFMIDRATLFQYTSDHPKGILTHAWARIGLKKLPEGITLTAEDYPYLAKKHLRGEVTYFSSIDELPVEARIDKETLRKYGDRSTLAIPLRVGGSPIGILVFTSIEKEIAWPEEMIGRAVFIGEIFANTLTRKNAARRLQRSYDEIRELKDRLQTENTYFQKEIKLQHNFDEIIGQSEALKYVLLKIEQSAPTDASVILLGETGTGKELVARAIHDKSLRHNRPLIKVDCGALQSTLIERELFGHEKGAFTNAHQQQIGRFEIAHQGTLFLDEIGELPLDLQPKLLRVIQDGEFERLGSPKTRKVDVRIIAATNRDLEAEVTAGRFRRDLWYRINVFPITIPPLRERREDIPLLVNWFVNKFSKKMGKKIDSIPQKALNQLTHRHWAGNIRELENTIERAAIISQGDTLTLSEPFECEEPEKMPVFSKMAMEDVEREHLRNVLKETRWRISGPKGAARILKLNPSTLRFRMKKLGINKFEGDS